MIYKVKNICKSNKYEYLIELLPYEMKGQYYGNIYDMYNNIDIRKIENMLIYIFQPIKCENNSLKNVELYKLNKYIENLNKEESDTQPITNEK